ncbi:MAG TPA: ABC transporter permease subunit, partial [Solirubrobacteraceae bacterium]|nr:ABC transporter permease subunit [Solirubrobacteraceae bacterium]
MSAISPDPKYALTPSGNLRRRMIISRTAVSGTIVAAAAAVIVLGILVYYAAYQGVSQLSLSFLTSDLPQIGLASGGGIGPALVGTAEVVLIATLIALPIAILTAIYLSEFADPRIGRAMTTGLEVMAGLPTIIAGIFIARLIVDTSGQSAWAAGLAVGIVEVPLIARASIEALRRVPPTMREAADALGVAHWRTVLGVILPTAANSIVTATILAVARGAGETAPVLMTIPTFGLTYQLNPGHAVPTVPLE